MNLKDKELQNINGNPIYAKEDVKEAVLKFKEHFSDVLYLQDKIKEIFGDFEETTHNKYYPNMEKK